MSLILDALRRSETEKKGIPSLSMVDDIPRAPSRFPKSIMGWGAGSLAVLLIVFGFQWFEQEDPAGSAPHGAVDAEVGVTNSPEAAPTTELRGPPEQTPTLAAVNPPPATVVEPPQSQGLDAETRAALNRAMWQDADASSRVVASEKNEGEVLQAEGLPQRPIDPVGRSAPSATTEPPADAPALDLQEVMERLAREAGEVALSPHPVPLLENLTQQQKDGVPTIIYSAHQVGGNTPAFVELNGSRLREGESRDGIRVVEILSDSVILAVSGTQFRLKALNSWVNL